MCGIFGALVVEKEARLNIAVLEELAVINEERGPHAFGFASTNNAKIQVFKSEGRARTLKNKIQELILPNATAFVGHTRHATHGSPADNKNNHPHRVPQIADPSKRDGVIVHNGVVSHYENIMEKYNLHLTSECDSEVIAKLLSSRALFEGQGAGRISTLKRAKLTAEALDCPSSFLFMAPRRFAAVRMGRPLWWHKYEGVVYFSSIPLDFDTDYARGSVCDNAVRTYNWIPDAGRWKLVGRDDVTRGLRGAYGARTSISELDRDWRKTSVKGITARMEKARDDFKASHRAEPRLTRKRIDDLLGSQSSYKPSEGKPHWKQVADAFKEMDRRPEKDGRGTQITYIPGSKAHSSTCKCSRCCAGRDAQA